MKTRRILFVLAIAALTALMVPASALALDSMHGGFADDTDACAGCHRTHTSYSTVMWTDVSGDPQSALLVGDGNIFDMCYSCHGPGAPGSTTDVEEGKLYDAPNGTAIGDLNGGAFDIIAPTGEWTSSHSITGSWGAWGGGTTGWNLTDGVTGTGPSIVMDCTSCHDPHGSLNYRILAMRPGGITLPVPGVGYVSSVETGFPSTGFIAGETYPAYEPNYTQPMYSKGYDMGAVPVENAAKGMSPWCAGCHTQYMSQESTYAASEWFGGPKSNYMVRHRHPMNMPLTAYDGNNAATLQGQAAALETTGIPLAHASTEKGAKVSQASDWVECLTCHRAHGTKATMVGASSLDGMAGPQIEVAPGQFISSNPYFAAAGRSNDDNVERQNTASALLRKDNRTVCQMCHQK